jgi:hypothetical protein
MSRIARMMFSRATRQLVPTIVTSDTANAIANDWTRPLGLSVKKRSKRLCSVENAAADQATRTRPRPIPTSTPSAVATTAYIQPSVANERTRSERRIPTARAMPISVLRSAASMTNRFTSRSSPARTPKLPMAVNIDVNPLPVASAASSSVRFAA